jgi:hypothetical protein
MTYQQQHYEPKAMKTSNIVQINLDALNKGLDVLIEYNRQLAESAQSKGDNPYLKIAGLLHECDKTTLKCLRLSSTTQS